MNFINFSLLENFHLRSVYLQAVVELYVIGALIVFGVVANIVSIVVLKRYRERRDSLFLLQASAAVNY